MRVSILTMSDSVAAGKDEDRSGPAVAARCKDLGWEIVSLRCSRTNPAIEAFLKNVADAGDGADDLILTTGGTGLGPRDVTPEATQAAANGSYPDLLSTCAPRAENPPSVRSCRAGLQVFARKPSLSIFPAARAAPSSRSTRSQRFFHTPLTWFTVLAIKPEFQPCFGSISPC